MSSLRDRIIAAEDIERETVEIPEWGASVEVRSPSGTARAAIAKVVAEGDDFEALYPILLIPCLFDPETGEQVFTAADADELNGKNGAVLERLAVVALRLSGVTEADFEDAKKG